MTVRVKTEITAVDKTRAAFDQVNQKLGGLRSAFAAVGASLTAVGFARFVGDAIQGADEINKLSTQLGASTEALSEYQFVADRTGVSFRELTTGWQRLSRRVAEAARGQGAAKDALRELGLEAQDLKELELDQQFEIVADALARVENESDKVRIAQKLLDSEGVKLIRTLSGGSAELQNLRGEARELGLTLSQDAADGASEALDAWTNLSSSGKALGLSLVRELGPALADTASWLAESIPVAADAAGFAFDKLRAFLASTAAKITGVFASIESALAAAAEFVGADTLAESFRDAAKVYDDSTEVFLRLEEKFERSAASAFEERVVAIERSVDFQSLYNEGLAQSAALTEEVTRTEKARRTEAERAEAQRLGAIESYVEALQTEADTLGLTNQELIEYELNKLNATEETIKHAQALREEVEAFEAIREVEEENEAIFKRSAELQKKSAKEVRSEWDKTADSLSSGFVDAIEGAQSFSDALEGVKNLLLEIAEEQLKNYFASQQPAVAGAGTGGAGGTGAGFLSLFSSFLPGFQHGGRSAGGPHVVGERGPEVRFGAETISPMLRVSVDVNGGNPFANTQSQSQFATEVGNVIATQLSRNG